MLKQAESDELVKFILENRKDTKAFRGWSVKEILQSIVQGIKDRACVIDKAPDGRILGIIIGEPNSVYGILEIKQVLTIDSGSLRRFAKMFQTLFGRYGWELQATRRDNLIRYKNTKRLISKLSNKR